MNVSEIREDVKLPGGTAVIRMLSWSQRDKAQAASTKASIQLVADMGGDVMKALREMDTPEAEEERAEARPEDPLHGLDQEAVLRFGVISVCAIDSEPWYSVANVNIKGTDTLIDGLAPDDADTLAHAIVQLSGRTEDQGKG